MILDDLYFRNSERREISLEYAQIRSQMRPYEEIIRQTLGFPFLDEYVKLCGQLSDVAERQCYRAGARFAVKFLLEALL